MDELKQFCSEQLPADWNVELSGEASDEEPAGQRLNEFWCHVFKMEHLNGSPKYPYLWKSVWRYLTEIQMLKDPLVQWFPTCGTRTTSGTQRPSR